jgi:hypothetical protein
MTLDEATNMGQIKFSYDKPMEVPLDYELWVGNNTYLNSTERKGIWFANETIPIEVYVFPGQL